MTTLTTDKHRVGLSDLVVTASDGLRHYAVLVEKLPNNARFDSLRDRTPFYVMMCALLDAYDDVKGYEDFIYPTDRYTETEIEHNFPTCVRCSGV